MGIGTVARLLALPTCAPPLGSPLSRGIGIAAGARSFSKGAQPRARHMGHGHGTPGGPRVTRERHVRDPASLAFGARWQSRIEGALPHSFMRTACLLLDRRPCVASLVCIVGLLSGAVWVRKTVSSGSVGHGLDPRSGANGLFLGRPDPLLPAGGCYAYLTDVRTVPAASRRLAAAPRFTRTWTRGEILKRAADGTSRLQWTPNTSASPYPAALLDPRTG